ncbi:MAG: universal stress protein [Rhodothermales bacterium]
MKTPRRIFHPTDFSPSADAALHVAIDAALRFDAPLLVGHVVYGGRSYWEVDQPNDRAGVEKRLREHVAEAIGAHGEATLERLDVTYHVIEHETAPAGVLHFAHESGIDLIVLGTHGRRGLRKLILGSVSLHVLHASRIDVLLVPATVEERREGHLLVPIDFHERTHAVVMKAGELADAYGLPVTLLHVLDAPDSSPLRTGEVLSAEVADLDSVARERLEEFAGVLADHSEVSAHLVTGRPQNEIIRWLNRDDVRMTVLASAGMTPTERLRWYPSDRDLGEEIRWAVGRVTERVAVRSPVPVWIVKRFEEEHAVFDVPDGMDEAAAYSSRRQVQG